MKSVSLYLIGTGLLISVFLAGMWFERALHPKESSTCLLQLKNTKRSLSGCELVAKQCINDVQDAEYKFKRCMVVLEEFANRVAQ